MYYQCNNVINYSFIDYIIRCYVPELQISEEVGKKINLEIFREAMLHQTTKYRPEDKTYDRLEYLGDAVFHLVITEYLYKRYDEEDEGFLTRLRIKIEKGDSMVEFSRKLELNSYVQVSGIRLNNHILEDIFEAFLGAFYLNFGIKYTRIFIVNLIEKYKDLSTLISHEDNYKDLLLRYFHQMKWGHPVYHQEITYNGKFKSTVKNPFDKKLGIGVASTKKKAEQLASKKALITLGVIVDGEIDPDWLEKIEKVESEKKEKQDKKPVTILNPFNKLMKKNDIRQILGKYNINLWKNDINMKIFHEAMTHRSYLERKKMSEEDKKIAKIAVKLQKKSNERLQFLGDSVIHFIIGEYLYHRYNKNDEGFLTRLRCRLENRDLLFYLANQSMVSKYVLVSHNIEVLHGRNNINIIGGGFEAFIGALYLEVGLDTTKQFILELIRTELDIDKIAESETNYKDKVLQLYKQNRWGFPKYLLLKEEGPGHAKIFTMGIYLGNTLVGVGRASSKKRAEQDAARKMFETYKKIFVE
ncbi:MAG: ribonuclease III domain-containing protein [Thermoplasmata archaeon]